MLNRKCKIKQRSPIIRWAWCFSKRVSIRRPFYYSTRVYRSNLMIGVCQQIEEIAINIQINWRKQYKIIFKLKNMGASNRRFLQGYREFNIHWELFYSIINSILVRSRNLLKHAKYIRMFLNILLIRERAILNQKIIMRPSKILNMLFNYSPIIMKLQHSLNKPPQIKPIYKRKT